MTTSQLPEGVVDAWRSMAMRPEMVDFALYPSRFMHPSWRRQAFPENLGDAVWAVPSAHIHLSRYIRRTMQLPDCRLPALSHAAWSIAMLPADQLDQLIRHIGAVVLSAEIRSAIGKDAIQEIVNQLGRDLYDFVLQRAGLLCPASIAPIGLSPADRAPESLAGRVMTVGRSMLSRYMDQCDTALWPRARLKLQHVAPSSRQDIGMAVTDATVTRIVTGVRREIE